MTKHALLCKELILFNIANLANFEYHFTKLLSTNRLEVISYYIKIGGASYLV